MIKVSVIIPVYNAQEYLRKCLETVLNQTLKEIEIICVDDGSTDHSFEILKEYGLKDSRITILTQPNQGAAVARNKGLGIAQGQYVSVLDADDFFELSMLEEAYNKCIQTNADIAIFRVRFYDENLREFQSCSWSLRNDMIPPLDVFSTSDVSKYIFQFSNGWAWDKLFKRKFINDNKILFQNTRIFNDAYFVFIALALSDGISVVNKELAIKRRSVKNSISSSKNKYWKDFHMVIQAIKTTLVEYQLYDEVEQSFVNYALHLPIYLLNCLDSRAKKDLFKFLKTEYFQKYEFGKYGKQYYYNKLEIEQYLSITKHNWIIWHMFNKQWRCARMLKDLMKYYIKKVQK